jgi:hypothetical protein
MEPNQIELTAQAGSWLNNCIAKVAAVLAAAEKALPDFVVTLTANLKGPRLRLRSKETKEYLNMLRTPCYLVGPLSPEMRTALAIDRHGQPVAGQARTIKVAPRYTLDGTYRGFIDCGFGANLPKDAKKQLRVSEVLYTMVAHLAASVAVPPNVSFSTNKAGRVIAKMIQHPSGWEDVAKLAGLAVPDKYTLSDAGSAQFRGFIHDTGPFPLSGLGAFERIPNTDPERFVRLIDATTGATLGKDGRPYKGRIPKDLFNILWTLSKEGALPVSIKILPVLAERDAAAVDAKMDQIISGHLATNIKAVGTPAEPPPLEQPEPPQPTA